MKAPLLFYLTLLVTFPSLYVFNALMGSRLDVLAALRLLVASISVMVAVLASLGPIIVFFAFSTPGGRSGYRFILLLVVVVSAAAGVLGLGYLLRMLNQYTRIRSGPETQPVQVVADSINRHESGEANSPSDVSPIENAAQVAKPSYERPAWSSAYQEPTEPPSPAKVIFRVWVFVFAMVGAQMSWVLRPFIGSPDQDFTWFRDRSGNFFQAVYRIVFQMFFGQ